MLNIKTVLRRIPRLNQVDRAESSRVKVFCIGAGKTGTTSLAQFFRELGYTVGDQPRGEALLWNWARRDFRPIIELAKTADFFQDVPFSVPYTFQAMDMAIPGSKFILTLRDADSWYGSLTRFHSAILAKNRLPSARDLQEFPYRYTGWIFEAQQLIYGISEDEPYHKQTLIECFERHNRSVQDYFAHRPESLLTVNIASPTAAEEITEFVGIDFHGQQMPHLNRTE